LTVQLSENRLKKAQRAPLSISIIIPAHNEEMRIGTCLRKTLDFFAFSDWDYEIIVSEDGSIDRTKEIVMEFSRETDRIKLISGKDRSGKGGGIKRAISFARGNLIGYMDADLSAHAEEFSRLVGFMDTFDVVVGSRILRGDLPPITRPAGRSFLSLGYSTLFRLLFRTNVRDPQCGLKLFRSQALKEIFALVKTEGFAFDSEILVWASKLGFRIKEVPIKWTHQNGSKVLPSVEIIAMSRDLVSIWKRVQNSISFKPQVNYPGRKTTSSPED
jgi:glycosyltransferase involved in cell wall biosynthesis